MRQWSLEQSPKLSISSVHRMRKMSVTEMAGDGQYGMSHSSAKTRENESGCLLGNCT